MKDAPNRMAASHQGRAPEPDRRQPGSSAFALQRPPVPDQCLTIGGEFEGPVWFRNSRFQPLDGVRSLERMVLAAEAVHLDAAVVRHHFLEALSLIHISAP